MKPYRRYFFGFLIFGGCFWGVLLFFFMAMSASTGVAASQDHSRPSMLAQDDQDADGKVSAEEFSGPQELFDRLDQDGDGYIDTSEGQQTMRANGRGNRVPGRFQQDDANGDGEVSRSEFSGPSDHFDRLDLDGDGAIQESEAQQSGPIASQRNRQRQ